MRRTLSLLLLAPLLMAPRDLSPVGTTSSGDRVNIHVLAKDRQH